jgi:translation initiation factor IF-3
MPASSPPKPGPELNTSMEVRLLVPGNESSKPDFMYGVVPYSEAKRMAAGLGLDLMLLNDKQAPPIYKICDSAKFKYDQEKKRKEASKSKANEVKEILLSYDIGEHDLEVRAKAAMRFLSDGDRVRGHHDDLCSPFII